MVAVRYDDLSLAFEFVSSGLPMEHNAYLSIDTGQTTVFAMKRPVFSAATKPGALCVGPRGAARGKPVQSDFTTVVNRIGR